ncbi:MAG TPA: hypothetical protein VKM54_11755 [Myxococcota bacterium]|nr:hypothetical protein [Myxococcota bacterium]
MQRARPHLLAFTLLEVLAAVAILALVYTVLARVGIQGFRAEGGADRRLRASLIADDLLAEIEGQLEMGSAPPLGEKDATRDEYLIHVRVTPSEIEIPPRSEAATQRMQAAAGKRPGGGSAPGAKAGSSGPTQSFFLPQAQGEPPPGRRIEVRVSWTEGTTESAVVRETYGLDQSAAQPLLLALYSAAQAEKAAAAGGVAPATLPQPGGRPGGETGGQPSPTGAVNPGMGPTP